MKKWQYENQSGQVSQHGHVEAEQARALEGYDDNEAVTKDIVIECAEKLGCEKRCKAALAEKCKLVRRSH